MKLLYRLLLPDSMWKGYRISYHIRSEIATGKWIYYEDRFFY